MCKNQYISFWAISIKIFLNICVILDLKGVFFMNNNILIKKLVDYIEIHIEEDLSLDKIAKALNYSKFYLIRTFHKETKGTIYQYIQSRRLTLAAKKLVETKKPIIEIAYEAQYHSQQAFSFAFHNLYGCTPKVYRKMGIFYPKQSKISMLYSLKKESILHYLWGGKAAA